MGGNEERNLPLETPAQPRWIRLCFKAQDGGELFFKFNADSKLEKLLAAYCRENKLEYDDLRFLYDSKRLSGDQTPTELDMEDGDVIDVMVHQTGGGAMGEL